MCEQCAELRGVRLAGGTFVEVTAAFGWENPGCGIFDAREQVIGREMTHDRVRRSLRMFARAWKKLAFTAPTELPSTPAICSCGMS